MLYNKSIYNEIINQTIYCICYGCIRLLVYFVRMKCTYDDHYIYQKKKKFHSLFRLWNIFLIKYLNFSIKMKEFMFSFSISPK